MTFLPQDVIRCKRDGLKLNADQIQAFIEGVRNNEVADAQIAALTMASIIRGLDRSESVALTRSMTYTGDVIDWGQSQLSGPVLDKHSTGGVGDKVSLLLAPLVAACGAYVPMISGRGLGHTGGTLDKLESIPGYRTNLDLSQLRNAIKQCGCAIIGQTAELAPADRRIYAVRDITATVECTGLICASILSKKLAAGLQGLVLDVKAGSGAFLPDLQATRELAQELVAIGNSAGLPTRAVLTDMNQVLGLTAGNALEVLECAHFLSGEQREPRLLEVTLVLAEEMLLLGGLAANKDEARQQLLEALENGAAAERFARMVTHLGGPADFLQRPQHYLAQAPIAKPVYAEHDGYIESMDVRAVGQLIVALGGGRRGATDAIDHAVGLSEVAGIGAAVQHNATPIAWLHARDEQSFESAAAALRHAITISQQPMSASTLILDRLQV